MPAGESPPPLPDIDTSVAHPARVYDYWLGGKDNFRADREAAEQVIALRPEILTAVRANRRFLGRAVHYLAADAGIRQFLDIGTGLPHARNTHEVAQGAAPGARIVYVDNDPFVLAHARALLLSTPEGACDYIEADVREPEKILQEAAEALDFGQPVAIMLLMTLQYVPDADDPHGIVARLMDATVPGSYLVVSDTTRDVDTARIEEVTQRFNERLGSVRQTRRTEADIARFFTGLEILEPGLVSVHRWRPGPDEPDTENDWPARCGVARKP
ncbi:MAG TPA: SAM-dependent methyltransferase [Streptosporangiaceae bacterium]|nr:SAM-dependent methyltransferase [Streptosporangiaceae bacterium]